MNLKKFPLWHISVSIINLILLGIIIIVFTSFNNNAFFSDIKFKDLIPLIIVIITLIATIPAYFINKAQDRDRLNLELQKNIELKRFEIKHEKYKNIIPYVVTKRIYTNYKLYCDFDPEFKIIADKHNGHPYGNKEMERELFDYCQKKISEIIFYINTFASNQVIESLHAFNKAEPNSNNKNNKKEFELLINNIREDLGYEKISFKYGNIINHN